MNTRTILAWTTLLGCVACGGGGGGGGGGASGTVPLTAQNATEAAAVAIDSAQGLMEIATDGTDIVEARGGDAASGPRSKFDLVGFVREQFDIVLEPRNVRRTEIERNGTCRNGGSYVALWNDRDDDRQTSTGDTFDIQFLICNDEDDPGDSETIDGRLFIDQIVIAGDPEGNFFQIGLRITFDNLTATDGSESITLNGRIATSLVFAGDVVTFRIDVSATLDGGSESFLGGTSIELTENAQTDTFTLVVDGAVSDTSLAGTIAFTTTAPFTGAASSERASSGVMVVRGGGGSTVTITVLDANQVRLDVDVDGDGQIDESLTVSWADLEDGDDDD